MSINKKPKIQVPLLSPPSSILSTPATLDDLEFETGVKTILAPKDRLKKFLLENIEGEPYLFQLEVSTAEGAKYVQNMRNELSRLRGKLRQRSQVPKRFKLILNSITPTPSGCEISIMRSMTTPIAKDPELDTILDVLTEKFTRN